MIRAYAAISYVVGMAGLVFWIAWQLPWVLVPWHMDAGVTGPLLPALAINAGLALLFGLQHSVMARPAFKVRWTRLIPPAAERSTYVMLSGVVTALWALCWQPVQGSLWTLPQDSLAWQLVAGLQLLGWATAVAATFLINHFELFGLAQAWRYHRGEQNPAPRFTEVFLYRLVRHPLQFGILIGLWAVPAMSTTHFLSSMVMTVYIFVGLHFEERNLRESLGADYADYQRRVPMLLPWPRPRRN